MQLLYAGFYGRGKTILSLIAYSGPQNQSLKHCGLGQNTLLYPSLWVGSYTLPPIQTQNWQPPPSRVVKINVDGAIDSQNGTGGVELFPRDMDGYRGCYVLI